MCSRSQPPSSARSAAHWVADSSTAFAIRTARGSRNEHRRKDTCSPRDGQRLEANGGGGKVFQHSHGCHVCPGLCVVLPGHATASTGSGGGRSDACNHLVCGVLRRVGVLEARALPGRVAGQDARRGARSGRRGDARNVRGYWPRHKTRGSLGHPSHRRWPRWTRMAPAPSHRADFRCSTGLEGQS